MMSEAQFEFWDPAPAQPRADADDGFWPHRDEDGRPCVMFDSLPVRSEPDDDEFDVTADLAPDAGAAGISRHVEQNCVILRPAKWQR